MLGPFIHTLPGGSFHDTMSKKSVNDSDKLESIGMKGHETFVREYDLSFQFDPILITGGDPSTAGPSGSTASTLTNASSGPSFRNENTKFTMSLGIRIDGDDIIFDAHGESFLYNPKQFFHVKKQEFSDMRISDFLGKLNDTWPKFERGGSILTPTGRTETFTTRSKLETLGFDLTPSKKTYTLLFEIDSSAPAPAPSQIPDSRPKEPSSFKNITISSEGPRNVSISSEPEVFSSGIPKEEEFLVDLEVIPVSYRVTVRTKTGNARMELTEAELGMSLDELLKKGGIAWAERKDGTLHSETKKKISSTDSLQRLGIRSAAQNLHLSFLLPVKTQVAPRTRDARPVKPHKSGVFDQIKLEVRVFQEGQNVFFNLRGQTNNWKGDLELSMKKSDYEKMTIDDLLNKLTKKWPVLEPEGWYQTTSGPIPFNGPDKLLDVGLSVNSNETSTYHLVFPTAEHLAPLPTTHLSSGENHPRRKSGYSAHSAHSGHSADPGNKSGISEGNVGVNVRIFYDNGIYNLQVNGAGGDFRGETDVMYKKADWPGVTFGDLKRKLRKWPELGSAGKFHSPHGNILFSDQDKLADIGVSAPEDGRPAVFQWSWEFA